MIQDVVVGRKNVLSCDRAKTNSEDTIRVFVEEADNGVCLGVFRI